MVMVFKGLSRCVWLAIAIPWLACGGGSSSSPAVYDAATDVSVTPADQVRVFLATMPEGATGTAWLWVRYGDGSYGKSASGPAQLFGELTVNVDKIPYDVIVHIPKEPSWTISQEPATGHYAVLSGVAKATVVLQVLRWTEVSAPPVSGRGLAGEEDNGKLATISGTVRDTMGNPVAGVTVYVADEAAAITGADGRYELAVVPGDVDVRIEYNGVIASQKVIAGQSDSPATGIDIAIDTAMAKAPPAAFSITGTILDAKTNAGVAGAVVELIRTKQMATTDAQGAFKIDAVQVFSGVISVLRQDYAWSRSGVYIALNLGKPITIKLVPLVQGFYGTWNYCYSKMRSGRQFRVGDEFFTKGTKAQQTFSNDGTAFLLNGLFQGPWRMKEWPSKPGHYWPEFTMSGGGGGLMSWVGHIYFNHFALEGDLLVYLSDHPFSADPDKDLKGTYYSKGECPDMSNPLDAGTDAAAPLDPRCTKVCEHVTGTKCSTATTVQPMQECLSACDMYLKGIAAVAATCDPAAAAVLSCCEGMDMSSFCGTKNGIGFFRCGSFLDTGGDCYDEKHVAEDCCMKAGTACAYL